MSEHPTLFRLDAHAAGDLDPLVEEHLDTCAPCAAYVERLRGAMRAHADDEGDAAADFVLGLVDRSRAREPERGGSAPATRSLRRISAAGAAILAAAAAIVLVGRGGPYAPGADAASSEPAVRFKGRTQLAVIRDRRGEQIRSATEVRVRPGDRVRAEVSVDDPRPVEVGFLGKDGTWILLLAPTLFEAGTYFSDRAAVFDDAPTEGWIIAGAPEAVARARAGRPLDEVSSVQVIAEP
ncbi:MAG: hypothetical protein KF850_31190 [Labilithrix sp.]|nr:hypothetical protein [Labilithrix sp.]